MSDETDNIDGTTEDTTQSIAVQVPYKRTFQDYLYQFAIPVITDCLYRLGIAYAAFELGRLFSRWN